ncbi:SUMO protein smt3, partial [Coemansia sp. IMI 209127]
MDATNNNSNDANDNVKGDVKDTKPDATSTEHINIKVVSADNSEVMFKIKRSTKLAKLMQAYCARAGKSFDT